MLIDKSTRCVDQYHHSGGEQALAAKRFHGGGATFANEQIIEMGSGAAGASLGLPLPTRPLFGKKR